MLHNIEGQAFDSFLAFKAELPTISQQIPNQLNFPKSSTHTFSSTAKVFWKQILFYSDGKSIIVYPQENWHNKQQAVGCVTLPKRDRCQQLSWTWLKMMFCFQMTRGYFQAHTNFHRDTFNRTPIVEILPESHWIPFPVHTMNWRAHS